MVAIAPIQQIAQKWAQNASRAVDYYRSGVQNPEENWEERTIASQDIWAEGVRQAADAGLFARGVQGKFAKWQRRATQLGPDRYRTGVQAAQDDYVDGFGPYRDAIERFNFTTARGPRGSAANYDRVREIGQMLHQLRIGGARRPGA